ncbi:HD-GYP domain-containing protein [Desulfovibrio inopinatus]|uniref:HD-GYP domain-containing protein n=1 Tax=Desulfovibrio inopinatus TaxID=102109 RepID=UPI0004002784|nr:HD-GYP domain-containing protein [Desulfovibrio inopinatus]
MTCLPTSFNKLALGRCEHAPQKHDVSASVSFHHLAEAFGHAVDAKDGHTANHSYHVAELADLVAVRMGISPHKQKDLHLAAHLHDIGKIGIPDAILKKPALLTPTEWEIVKHHPRIGVDILAPCLRGSHDSILDMILYHHERFNGSGYPVGLCGEEIPLGARIIAVVDSYSAMVQHRPYRSGLSHLSALVEIHAGRGKLYDPQVVDAFLAVQTDVRQLTHLVCPRCDTPPTSKGEFPCAPVQVLVPASMPKPAYRNSPHPS